MDYNEKLNSLGISCEFTFVPFSRSRHKDNKQDFNYTVNVKYKGRSILVTDYSMGVGHSPSYNREKNKYQRESVLRAEVEYGTVHLCLYGGSYIKNTRKPILPELASVICCLVSDASVIDFKNFEAWATDYGYDTDSISAEATYRACLETALSLRSGLGEALMQELRELFQNY